jgi:hypothetical protein
MRTPPTTFCQPLPRQDLPLTDSANGVPDNASIQPRLQWFDDHRWFGTIVPQADSDDSRVPGGLF